MDGLPVIFTFFYSVPMQRWWPMSVFMPYIERDDVVHWVVLHKTRQLQLQLGKIENVVHTTPNARRHWMSLQTNCLTYLTTIRNMRYLVSKEGLCQS